MADILPRKELAARDVARYDSLIKHKYTIPFTDWD